jgi:hypothetical protein
MAAIICEDHFQTASSLAEALNTLAAEIPSPTQEKKFRQLVEARLA